MTDTNTASDQESAVLTKRLANGVTEIVLNRPEKRNAFDDVIIQQLISAFTDAHNDNDTKVVILRSEGKHFSAGADSAGCAVWQTTAARKTWMTPASLPA